MPLAAVAALVLAAAGCASEVADRTGGDITDHPDTPEDRSAPSTSEPADYSILRPGNRFVASVGDRYIDEVQPALASRCAVCHACTNGPCQLNMTSYAALQ